MRPQAIIFILAAAICGGCDHDHEAHKHSPSCAHGHKHEPEAHAHSSSCAHDHKDESQAHEHSSSCAHGHEHGAQAHKHDGEHNIHHGHDVRSVTVAKPVQTVMGLKTAKAEKRRVSSGVAYPGRYELSPDARRAAATPVAGKLDIKVKPLAAVKKGDILFTVAAPEITARKNEIAVIEERLSVYRKIKTPNAELENTLQVRRSELKAALANAEECDGAVTVRSECDGIVESYTATDGSWLDTGAPVLTVIRPNALRFKALVAAADAIRIKNSSTASVNGRDGKIQFGIGDDSGIVPLYVLFDGDVEAIAGERATAEFSIEVSGGETLAVPSGAIVTVDLAPTVFIRDGKSEERFLAVRIRPGASGAGWTAVEGLPSGDVEVVTDGAYELKLALMSAGAAPSGHFHADGTFHEGEH